MKWRLAVAIVFMCGSIFGFFTGNMLVGWVWGGVSVVWYWNAYTYYRMKKAQEQFNDYMKGL